MTDMREKKRREKREKERGEREGGQRETDRETELRQKSGAFQFPAKDNIWDTKYISLPFHLISLNLKRFYYPK